MPHPTHRHAPVSVPRGHSAFTLIELLAVIAIAGVLAALVIGSVAKIRDAARRDTCSSNLRQIGAAFQLYAADNRGLYPAPRMVKGTTSPNPNPAGQNWQVEISPYLIRGTNTQNDGQTAAEVKNAGTQTNVAHCPSYDLLFDPNVKLTSQTNLNTAGYGMNYNLNIGTTSPLGANLPSSATRFPAAAIPRPAKDVLVGDSSDFHLNVSGSWPVKNDPMFPDGYASGAPYRHGSSANYLFCDGHVASLSPADALAVLSFKP